MTESAQVYIAIGAVMADLAKEGISKDSKNQQQGYSFRGIDAIYNALAPILARNKLCVLPRILTREVTERQTKSGSALFYVVVEAEFDLVSSEDGSTHTIRTFGEAMDSADKATNKAMSAAYKYAAMQAFCIPTEGDNDADATTHDVSAEKPFRRLSKSKPEADEVFQRLQATHAKINNTPDFDRFWSSANVLSLMSSLPKDWEDELQEQRRDKAAQIAEREALQSDDGVIVDPAETIKAQFGDNAGVSK